MAFLLLHNYTDFIVPPHFQNGTKGIVLNA